MERGTHLSRIHPPPPQISSWILTFHSSRIPFPPSVPENSQFLAVRVPYFFASAICFGENKTFIKQKGSTLYSFSLSGNKKNSLAISLTLAESWGSTKIIKTVG